MSWKRSRHVRARATVRSFQWAGAVLFLAVVAGACVEDSEPAGVVEFPGPSTTSAAPLGSQEATSVPESAAEEAVSPAALLGVRAGALVLFGPGDSVEIGGSVLWDDGVVRSYIGSSTGGVIRSEGESVAADGSVVGYGELENAESIPDFILPWCSLSESEVGIVGDWTRRQVLADDLLVVELSRGLQLAGLTLEGAVTGAAVVGVSCSDVGVTVLLIGGQSFFAPQDTPLQFESAPAILGSVAAGSLIRVNDGWVGYPQNPEDSGSAALWDDDGNELGRWLLEPRGNIVSMSGRGSTVAVSMFHGDTLASTTYVICLPTGEVSKLPGISYPQLLSTAESCE